MFGSLFAKTHRVHRIFNNARVVRIRLSARYVLGLLGIAVGCECGLLLILTTALPGRIDTSTNADASVAFTLCSAAGASGGPSINPVIFLAAAHVVFLIWGAFLAFRTRHVSSGFNESLWIGLSIYNILACELLGFILESLEVRCTVDGGYLSSGLATRYMLRVPYSARLQFSTPSMQFFTALVRLGVPPVATLLLVYVPKAVALGVQLAGQSYASRRGLRVVPLADDRTASQAANGYEVGSTSSLPVLRAIGTSGESAGGVASGRSSDRRARRGSKIKVAPEDTQTAFQRASMPIEQQSHETATALPVPPAAPLCSSDVAPHAPVATAVSSGTGSQFDAVMDVQPQLMSEGTTQTSPPPPVLQASGPECTLAGSAVTLCANTPTLAPLE